MSNGNRSHQKRPNGALKAVNMHDSSSTFGIQNREYLCIAQLGGKLFNGGHWVMGSFNDSDEVFRIYANF